MTGETRGGKTVGVRRILWKTGLKEVATNPLARGQGGGETGKTTGSNRKYRRILYILIREEGEAERPSETPGRSTTIFKMWKSTKEF